MRAATRPSAGELTVPDGDPAALREAARRMRHLAARALATHGVRGDSSVDLSRVWSGDAAALAAAELALLSGRSRRVLPHLDVAGSALARYADALERTILRSRALRARMSDVHEEHARRVALIRTSIADPISCAVAVGAADRRLAQEVATTRRHHGALLDDFRAAGTACARTLAALSASTVPGGAGSDAVTAEIIGNLPLVRRQVAAASMPPPPAPAAEPEWHETVLDNLTDAAAWTYNHTGVPLVNTAANVAEAVAEHPEDLIEMAIGAGMIFLGAGGEVGGLALDATGVGAVAGVPINVASAALIAGGATALGQGAGRLVEHARQKDHQWLHEVDSPRTWRGQEGDPLPATQRPHTAGSNWEGRVAKKGRGEVWQAPDKINLGKGKPENADSVRLMDPKPGYGHGYVRFYNSHGQPLDLLGKPMGDDVTHIPRRQDGGYDIPEGWNPS
jgi:hypothetical protein